MRRGRGGSALSKPPRNVSATINRVEPHAQSYSRSCLVSKGDVSAHWDWLEGEPEYAVGLGDAHVDSSLSHP